MKVLVVTVLVDTVELRPESQRMLGFNSGSTSLRKFKTFKRRKWGDGQRVEPFDYLIDGDLLIIFRPMPFGASIKIEYLAYVPQ